jgi:nitroreductase
VGVRGRRFKDGALPSDFFRRNVFISFQEDTLGIQLRAHIGVENLLWGSDYPHAESTFPRSRQIVDRMLYELALKAPTGRNAQNGDFILVKDHTVKARLARLYRITWGLFGRIGRRLTASYPKLQRQLDAGQWQVDHFEAIPVLVVACLRGLRPLWPPLAVISYYGSIYPSVQNLLLAARAAGLGGALITLPLWSTWLARRALGLPWRVTPCAVVPLGWPIGRYGPTARRPVGDVVHLDRYGHQPFKARHP